MHIHETDFIYLKEQCDHS